MTRWTAEGLDPEAFWRQTPRTFVAIMKGRAEAARASYNERMGLAWHIAALSLSDPKKFPKLGDLLIEHEDQTRRGQTPGEMLAAMQNWVVATRGMA